MKRKNKIAALLLAALLAFSSAACAGEKETADPTVQRVVNYGISNGWDALMPYNSVSGSNYARIVYDKIYDRLAYVHGDGSLSPRGAKSWESADGGFAILFTLDERAAFHDGTPVTARHWADTFRLMTDPECPTLGRSNFAVLTGTDDTGVALAPDSVGAEAVEEYVLKLTFKERTTPEDFLLSRNREFYVLPTHLLEDIPPAELMSAELWEHPIGSGPCVFEEELVGSRLTLTSNEDYQLGAPGFDKLVITVMDKASLLTALMAGDLDYYAIGGSISEENAQVARQAGLTVLEGETPATFYELMINNETVTRELRTAIDLALDKELLCQQNTGGLGSVAASSILPGSGLKERSWTRDVEGARAIVDEYGGGFRAGGFLTLAVTSNRAGLAALIQQNLQEVGIEVFIETVDSATLFSGMSSGSYDLAIASHTPSPRPLWFAESRFTEGNNIFHVSEEELQRYAGELSLISGAADEKARGEAIEALEEHLAEEKPFLPLWFARALHVQSPTVSGIDYVSASCSNENVWEWQKD